MDPADAFVRLYDALRQCPASRLEEWWELGQDTAERVCCDVEATGDLPEHWMPAGPAPTPRSFGVLCGLDRALRNADPAADTLANRQLGYLRTRLRLTGRLNDETNGKLLFRRARSARPTALPGVPVIQGIDDFLSLLRISDERSSHIHIERVLEVLDLPDIDYGTDRDLDPLPPLPIAQLPLLADKDDLRWELYDPAYYQVAPSDDLRVHLRAALTALDSSDAVLALLPEASLNDALVQEWQELLRNNPRPEHSRLTWIMIGTGPVTSVGNPAGGDRPPNRAVLLHRRGDLLLTQDKQHGFTFTGDQQRDYGVDLGGARAERIAEGTEMSLLEARHGRFGILICEDLNWHYQQGDVIAAGVTHLLVPVLAAAMWDRAWQAMAAKVLVIEAGTDIAVSNGLAIHRFVPARYTGATLTPAPTLLIIASLPGKHDQWPNHSDLVRSYACPEDVMITDPREDSLTPRVADW
jgi:predicted amidohydrolase